MLRRLVWTVLGLLAACGGSESTNPTPPPPPPPVAPPPPPSPGSPLTIVATGSLPAAGGTLTVSKPGSPVNGMQVVLPAGAVTAPLAVTLGTRALSAALPAELTARSPVVSVVTDGPALTTKPYSIRIPVSIPAGALPLAVVYDTLTGFVSVLPVADWDATSVTVSSSVLEGSDLGRPAAAAPLASANRSGGMAHAGGSAHTVLLTIASGTLSPGDIATSFHPGVDNWEFDGVETVYGPHGTAAGEVLSEWLWPAGNLHNVAQREQGVWSSNAGGIMLTAGLSRDFDEAFAGSLSSIPARLPNNANRHAGEIFGIQVAMKHYAQPVPVMLLDPAGNYTVVLAIGWNVQGQYFTVMDPVWGDIPQQLKFGATMVPYVDVLNLGRHYTEPVQVLYYPLFRNIPAQVAQVLSPAAPEDFAALWPAWRIGTWDTRVRGGNKVAADTIFMLRDTTRIWVSAALTPGQATSLPVPSGETLQPLEFWVDNISSWTRTTPAPGGGMFLDFSTVLSGVNAWIDTLVGVHAQYAQDASTTVWLGWQSVRIIKYNVKLKPIRAAASVPVNISANSLGGPALPSNAIYEWQFVEEGQTVRITGSPSIQHTFPANGLYNIKLTVLHPNNSPVARASTTADVGNILSITQSPNYTLDPNQLVTFDATYTGPTLAHPLWNWNMGDGTITPTTTPTVQYAYGLPAPLTSKTYTMTLELFNGDTLVATSSLFPRVSNGGMQAWRIETFTQVGAYTGFNPGTPSHYKAAVNYQDGFLSQVLTTPGDGFLLLQPQGAEPGIFFEVVQPGTGNTVTYYQTGAFLAMVARTQGNGSFFVNGGNDHAGAINGAAYFGLQAPPGQTAGAFLNLITAVKNGDVLTGTMTFKLDPSWGGAVRVFDFKANRVN